MVMVMVMFRNRYGCTMLDLLGAVVDRIGHIYIYIYGPYLVLYTKNTITHQAKSGITDTEKKRILGAGRPGEAFVLRYGG